MSETKTATGLPKNFPTSTAYLGAWLAREYPRSSLVDIEDAANTIARARAEIAQHTERMAEYIVPGAQDRARTIIRQREHLIAGTLQWLAL